MCPKMRYQNDAVEQGSKGGEEKKSELALMQPYTLFTFIMFVPETQIMVP